MRIAMLVTDLEQGGTPLRLARLALELRDLGIDVRVGCLAPPGPVSQTLKDAGVRTFACNARDARDFGALRRLSRVMRELRPDLIHATLTHANVAARLVGRRRGVAVLTSTATIEIERRWHAWIERLTGRFDAGHIVNSRVLAQHVHSQFRVPLARIHVIPPAINAPPARVDRAAARAALGLADHEFTVAWVGRMDPVKRADVLVNCAEILSDTPTRFFLVGDGPHRPTVERLLAASSARSRVQLLGWREDFGDVLSAADAFVLPSLTEGVPNALLEAMAFGLPAIAADVPTLREISNDGRRLLLAAGQRADAYADAIRFLRANAVVRDRLAREGRDWAQRYVGARPAAEALLKIYADTLASRPWRKA